MTCEYCQQDFSAPICGAVVEPVQNQPRFHCTRPPRHDGDHVACGAHHNIARSPNTNEKPLTDTMKDICTDHARELIEKGQ